MDLQGQQKNWIKKQLPKAEKGPLVAKLIEWCEINSGSTHPAGLKKMGARLLEEFSPLAEFRESIPLRPCQRFDDKGEAFEQPLGEALRFTCRPQAPVRVFFSGHYDTVYDSDHPFQACVLSKNYNSLRGPGVADMKGGLLVMLEAIRILESFPKKESLGWEILLNPDEEIGSPASRELLEDAAKRFHFGLVFECSTPEGGLIQRRPGSGAFRAEAHGVSAHAGRDFELGNNAIEALAAFLIELQKIRAEMKHAIINVAQFHSSFPLNTVPDRAVAQLNIRVPDSKSVSELNSRIEKALAAVESDTGVKLAWTGKIDRPPRVPGKRTAAMESALEDCLKDLDQPYRWMNTGGGTDGNILLAAGLPNIDSLGVRGKNLHSDRETMITSSLIERIHLVALFLTGVAAGAIDAAAFSRSLDCSA